MALRPRRRRRHQRPRPDVRLPRKERAAGLEDEKAQAAPLAHHFRRDPAGVEAVDDDARAFGGGGDAGGEGAGGVDVEEFGDVVAVGWGRGPWLVGGWVRRKKGRAGEGRGGK